MDIENKGKLIAQIIGALQREAILRDREFDAGDAFFALSFRNEAELKKIARAAKINLHSSAK